jgi:hypothetical protein
VVPQLNPYITEAGASNDMVATSLNYAASLGYAKSGRNRSGEKSQEAQQVTYLYAMVIKKGEGVRTLEKAVCENKNSEEISTMHIPWNQFLGYRKVLKNVHVNGKLVSVFAQEPFHWKNKKTMRGVAGLENADQFQEFVNEPNSANLPRL